MIPRIYIRRTCGPSAPKNSKILPAQNGTCLSGIRGKFLDTRKATINPLEPQNPSILNSSKFAADKGFQF